MNRGKQDRSFMPVLTINNKYIGGICKTCGNEFVDLETHYQRKIEHRVRDINHGKNSRK